MRKNGYRVHIHLTLANSFQSTLIPVPGGFIMTLPERDEIKVFLSRCSVGVGRIYTANIGKNLLHFGYLRLQVKLSFF